MQVAPYCNNGLIRDRRKLLECLRKYGWMTYFCPVDGSPVIRAGDVGTRRLIVHLRDGKYVALWIEDGEMYITKEAP